MPTATPPVCLHGPGRRRDARRLALLGGALAGLVLASCDPDESHRGGSGPGRSRGDSAGTPSTIVQVAALSDSAAARAMADSFAHDGWLTRVQPAQAADTIRWRVRLVIPGGLELARLVAHSLVLHGADAIVTSDTALVAAPGVDVHRVNRGTHGMAARVRWALTPDRRAFLVVEDPAGVENDPLPDGFVLAAEPGLVVQRDSVWDVAPSPDWSRLAYARAYTTAPGERPALTPNDWHKLAGAVGLPESMVKEHAFPTSGMAHAYGAARPFVVDLTSAPPASARDTTRDTPLELVEGWRVRWTRDGSRLALGAPPEVIADDGRPARWRLVDPVEGESRGTAQDADLARIAWNEGPTLDVSTIIDIRQRRAFRAGPRDVESEGGWIRVFTRGDGGLRTAHMVGPGIALSATATGEFIAALAPDPRARPYEASNLLVVYHVRP